MNTYSDWQAPIRRRSKAKEFRRVAREGLKKHWGIAVITSIVASVLGGTSGGFNFNFNFNFNFRFNDGSTDAKTEDLLERIVNWLGQFDSPTENLHAGIEKLLSLPGVSLFLILGGAIFTGALLFSLFVGAPVTVGYRKFSLTLADRSEEPKINLLFSFFGKCFGAAVCTRLLKDLLGILCAVFVFAGLGAYGYSVLLYVCESPLPVVLGVFGAGCLIITVGVILSILFSYRYAMAEFILADYPTLSAFDVLRNSRMLMKGNKWRLFCLQLSFFGWSILAVLSCGIGVLWLVPYENTAIAAFYDEISGRATAREIEFPSINPDDYTQV